MSYSFYLLRFVDGEPVPMDAERFRRTTEPHVVEGGPSEGFSRLLAEDGGTVDLYHADQGGGGLSCVTATHLERGAVTRVLARLAVELGASIVPQDGPTVIFREEDRGHLPAELRDGAVLSASTVDVLPTA